MNRVWAGPGQVGLILLLAASVLVGCADETPVTGSTIVDSLGIRIVESTQSAWTPDEVWEIVPQPELIIGAVDGDERQLLNDVRGARRFPDGRVAVLDAGSYRVRVYDSKGHHLVDMGGEGDGPSEFRYPQFLEILGDRLFVYEYFPARFTWFTADGEFIRRDQAPQPAEASITRAMAFGLLSARWLVGLGFPTNREFSLGVNRRAMPIWRFDLREQALDSLGTVPGFEEAIDFPRPRTTRHSVHMFGKNTFLATSKREIYAASNDSYSIQVLDSAGVLRRIIRRQVSQRAVAPADVGRYVEQRIEAAGVRPEERPTWEESFRDPSVASVMPAYQWIQVDADGNLWVEDWHDVGLTQGPFSVFDSAGVWLGDVAVPEGLVNDRGGLFQKWVEIGSDYFLGVWVDDLGVEQVRLHRIRKE